MIRSRISSTVRFKPFFSGLWVSLSNHCREEVYLTLIVHVVVEIDVSLLALTSLKSLVFTERLESGEPIIHLKSDDPSHREFL
jgi:hypothetical protein